jgi:hypothetical protein
MSADAIPRLIRALLQFGHSNLRIQPQIHRSPLLDSPLKSSFSEVGLYPGNLMSSQEKDGLKIVASEFRLNSVSAVA